MKQPLIKKRDYQNNQLNTITTSDSGEDLGITFSLLPMNAGTQLSFDPSLETAVLLMTGQVVFAYDSKTVEVQRDNLFEQDPAVLHVPAHQCFKIMAGTDCELAVMQVANQAVFEPMVFEKGNLLESEDRGIGLLNNTSYRVVRTVFDKRNRPESNLVVGEVITFPGGWSSYPPHHHKQPEIYHYRFTEEKGFGFAQCGDNQIFKAEDGDTLLIENERDHAQVAAPGYGMYYLWFIRHLPGNPYHVPEFTQSHEWTRAKEANQRVWQGIRKVVRD